MTEYVYSNDFPKIQALQGGILVPFCVTEVNSEGPEWPPVSYKYRLIRMPISGTGAMHKLNSLDNFKSAICEELNRDLQAHIGMYYDQGIQTTIIGYGSRALADNRPDVIAECKKVQDWIDSALDYYDEKKKAIVGSVTEEELIGITWNFAAGSPLKNYVNWRDIKKKLSEDKIE